MNHKDVDVTYWNIVGKAVTMNLPLNPGDVVTSTAPTFIPKPGLKAANSFHFCSKALQAGHQGA